MSESTRTDGCVAGTPYSGVPAAYNLTTSENEIILFCLVIIRKPVHALFQMSDDVLVDF